MRHKLKEINGAKRTFEATVAKLDNSAEHVLLKDITLDGHLVTDHVWSDQKHFLRDFVFGQRIEFRARVVAYRKNFTIRIGKGEMNLQDYKLQILEKPELVYSPVIVKTAA